MPRVESLHDGCPVGPPGGRTGRIDSRRAGDPRYSASTVNGTRPTTRFDITIFDTRKEQKHGARRVFNQLGRQGSWASRKFYEKFCFTVFGGDPAQNWLILKNGDHVIGVFQGMFEKHILSLNPGWDSNAQKLNRFTDVRELQRKLKAQGVTLMNEADEKTTGPASLIAVDPDGNPIMVDQHV